MEKTNILKKMNFIGVALLLFSLLLISSCKQKADKAKLTQKDFVSQLTEEEITNGILTPEIMWKFGRVSDAQLSPDGRNIVYGITRYNVPTNKSNTDIYLIPVEGGTPKQLTTRIGGEFNQRWTADGKKIGYLSAQSGSVQLWEMNPDGSSKKQISNIEEGINSFEYSPTGNRILYCKEVKLEKNTNDLYPDLPLADVKIIDNLMYRHWDQWNDYKHSHIFVADYSNNKLSNSKDIMEGELWDAPMEPYFDNSEMTWSPDGKTIAYTCKKLIGREYAVSTNSDIYLYNIETKKTKNLTKGNLGYDRYPRFSQNGKKIAWQSMETPGYESDKDRLLVYDFTTDKKEYITENFDHNVSNIVWSDNSIYFISGLNATYQIFKVDLNNKKYTQITKGIHNYNSFSKVDNIIIGAKMSMSMATEIFKVDEETGNDTELTFTNKNIYDKIEMGKVEENWIKTTDGKKMLVWLIYPPKFDKNKKYPALLYCQGGPQSAVSQFFSFRWNFQIMAANDYVIIAPNRRGLPSFGQEWNAQISGDYGGQNMKDYFSATDYFKKESFIDENRLGSIGASYGGFSTYWLAGNHQKRFKAFIAHCGMYNFESFYAATEEPFFPNHDLGGNYWDKNNKVAQASYAQSPHKFVQNWDTPIMIITGGRDFRIPYTQSLEAFNAAQLRGIPSKLLFFPDETHFVVKPQNAILWQKEFFGWLDKWLK